MLLKFLLILVTSIICLVKGGSFEKLCRSTAGLPDRDSGCCGIENNRADKTLGGAVANLDEFPWLALIEYHKGDEINLYCGGALINGRYVLTAAHCLAGDMLSKGVPLNVRLGEFSTLNDPKEKDCSLTGTGESKDCTPGVTVIPIEKIILHEEYIPGHQFKRHDIALIRLSQMAPYTEFIRPICLPETDVTTKMGLNPAFFVAGWGRTTSVHSLSVIKQYIDVPYVDDCQSALIDINLPLWKGQMCTGGELGKDACNGDSGGPVMYERAKVYEAVGVIGEDFNSDFCGLENKPAVHTRVYQYLDWIKKNIEP